MSLSFAARFRKQQQALLAPLIAGLCLLAAASPAARAQQQTLTFEGFAPAGVVVNVNPDSPYTEAGFTLTPTNAESAVFGQGGATMFGNPSDWFGFSGTNAITLTNDAGSPFDLLSVLIGPITFAQDVPIEVTLVGNLAGGGTLSATFTGLTTATTASLDWQNLTGVVFTASSDAGIDDIRLSVAAIPEPGSLALAVLGGGGGGLSLVLGLRRRRAR